MAYVGVLMTATKVCKSGATISANGRFSVLNKAEQVVIRDSVWTGPKQRAGSLPLGEARQNKQNRVSCRLSYDFSISESLFGKLNGPDRR